MDRKQLHGPVATLLRYTIALVAFAAGAPTFPECLRAPLSNGAVGFMPGSMPTSRAKLRRSPMPWHRW